jgi:glycosyltransferase involved in cell wall biosynthesis
VARIARGLAARGVDVQIHDASAGAPPSAGARPSIVHAFHAHRAGPAARELAATHATPLVVTLTGTDVSHDLACPETAPAVRAVLTGAAAIVAFHDSVAAAVRDVVPEVAARLVVVPQGVALGPAEPARGAPAITGDPCILFPAGIRPVKQPLRPLAALDGLARERPGLRLWYVGPVLDQAEGRRLDEALAGRPWARHLGSVPHERMAGLLDAAHIVLNCSRSEGGMANAVLEALARGRAVLAADIPGNRSLIEDGVTGLLFDGDARLAAQAARLAADPALRARLGEAGRRVAARFTPDREIDAYLALYERVLRGRPGA